MELNGANMKRAFQDSRIYKTSGNVGTNTPHNQRDVWDLTSFPDDVNIESVQSTILYGSYILLPRLSNEGHETWVNYCNEDDNLWPDDPWRWGTPAVFPSFDFYLHVDTGGIQYGYYLFRDVYVRSIGNKDEATNRSHWWEVTMDSDYHGITAFHITTYGLGEGNDADFIFEDLGYDPQQDLHIYMTAAIIQVFDQYDNEIFMWEPPGDYYVLPTSNHLPGTLYVPLGMYTRDLQLYY